MQSSFLFCFSSYFAWPYFRHSVHRGICVWYFLRHESTTYLPGGNACSLVITCTHFLLPWFQIVFVVFFAPSRHLRSAPDRVRFNSYLIISIFWKCMLQSGICFVLVPQWENWFLPTRPSFTLFGTILFRSHSSCAIGGIWWNCGLSPIQLSIQSQRCVSQLSLSAPGI